MNQKEADKLIELYKSGHKIFTFIETDDYNGWGMADGVVEESSSMTFDNDSYIALTESHIFASNFKVFNEVMSWYV
jgi:hypothetical protein